MQEVVFKDNQPRRARPCEGPCEGPCEAKRFKRLLNDLGFI